MNGELIGNFASKVQSWADNARGNVLFRLGLGVAALVAVIDQATKYWIVNVIELPLKHQIEISGIFDLTFVRNFGASFGMLAGGLPSRIFLSVVVTCVVAFLIGWLGRLQRRIAALGVGFIIGGALGNLYDRLAYGYVVDFLDFSGLYFPWVFNVADAAINVGFACLLLDAWQTRERKPAA